MRLTSVIFLCSLLFGQVCAQQDAAVRKLQIAQQLEQAGDWVQAAKLYEDLWQSDSMNYAYFDALRRTYARLKQYGKATSLIKRRMRMRPTDTYLTAFLGGVYFDEGRHEKADSVWGALLKAQPRQRQLYVLVAQQMQERRLFARARDTYRRGREAMGNPAEFAQELALLHSATQAYGDAVSEYLRLLEQNPHQLGYIQSRIASFTLKDEGLRQAAAVVRFAVKNKPSLVAFRSLFAWILMEQGNYDEALSAYRSIDSLSASNGEQLNAFAGMAMREGRYAEAFQAYEDIVQISPVSPLRPQAMYGMAQAFEESLAPEGASQRDLREATSSSLSKLDTPDSAIALYQRVMTEYPESRSAMQSLFRIGVIRYERQFDLDGALQTFSMIYRDTRAGNLAAEALLKASDVLIAQQNVTAAHQLLLDAPPAARAYLQDRYTLHLARVTYYRARFEETLALLKTVITSLDRDAANDALELYYHVQEGSLDSSMMALFVRGELLEQQHAYSEALVFFDRVSRNARTASLASRSRLASADMMVRLGKPSEAIQLLDSIVSTFRTDVLRDRAMYRIGVLYEEEIRDVAKAREAYQKFLTMFPTSIYLDEVRRRLRGLQGDAR